MRPAGFEPTIRASERPQTHALDGADTGIGEQPPIINSHWRPEENKNWSNNPFVFVDIKRGKKFPDSYVRHKVRTK